MNRPEHKSEGVNRTKTMRFLPFFFTGKERDRETGFSYFGARYYDCDLSGLFLSVDPMSDKYPYLSPYAYCAWNPVKLVDPNGKTWETTKDMKRAERIKEEVCEKIANLQKYRAELQNKNDLNCLSDKKIKRLEYELSEIENQIALLSDFVKGIDELSISNIRYTFNPTRSVYNKVKTYAYPGALYKINYQSGNDGNLVHEITHTIQVDRMENKKIDKMSLLEMEQGAYSTQYSFSPNSMPNSDSLENPSSKISAEWIRKIYYYENGKQTPYENL